MKIFLYISIGLVLLTSCTSTKEKKSAKYYFEHEAKITEILSSYDKLYHTQPFNLGFSERDYSKVGIDIITDTVRYAITNQLRQDAIHQTVSNLNYDTVELRKLYIDLYDIRAIWLGKDEMYYLGKASWVTYLSFKSVAVGNPFLDRKFYTLVFFDPEKLDTDFKSELDKQGFKLVKDNIYFKIMGRFR